VLGAGASYPYALPLGKDLRRQILSWKDEPVLVQSVSSESAPDKLHSFIEAFRFSEKYSVDAFLARNDQYVDVGKKAIAHCILRMELLGNLFRENLNESWYQHFWNKISDVTWDEFDLSKLSIVTFNYDRSLEKYLTVAAINLYGKSMAEVKEKLSKMNVIHVYGSLGPAWPWEDGYLEYGLEFNAENLSLAARSIEVIPEARDTSPKLNEAIKLLKNADKIAFLGFGFDSLNMTRLNLEESCKLVVLREAVNKVRPMYFTCKGLEVAEVRAIAAKIDHELIFNSNGGLPANFHDADCMTMLKKTLFFG